MKKKTANLVGAVVVLAVLSGAYAGVRFYAEKQEEKEQESEETETVKLMSIGTDDMKSLGFFIDNHEVTFEKDGDDWIKSDEKDFPVNQDKLTEAAGTLYSVEADRALEDVEDLSEYGLDDPSNTITVTTEEEKTVLQVGEKNTSTGQYYIKMEGDDSTVYVVESSVVEPFMKNLYDYAQGNTFPTIDSSTISKVSVSQGDSLYELEKDDESGTWDIKNETETDSADSAKASSLTSAFSSMSYGEFVNYDCENLSEYGLDKPYAEITVNYQEEEETDEDSDSSEKEESEPVMLDKELILQIGDEAGDSGRYVRVNDSKEIYTISNDTLDTFLGKTNEDFWNMTVNYLSVNNLETLDVTYKGESYTINVSRETSEDDEDSENSTTTLSYQLNGEDIDSLDFTTFYNKLINMAGQKRLTDEFKEESEPEMEVVFTDVDGNTKIEEYYPYDTNFYAAVIDEKVYLVNKMTAKEMISSFEEMISKDSNEISEETEETEE